MSKQEEEYIHLVSSSGALNNSRKILLEIKRQKDNPLLGPAFQFALVEYSKPYTISYGAELDKKGNPKYKFILTDKFISDEFKDLHNQILTDRKKMHAHDDLSIKDAKVLVSKTRSDKFVGIIQNKIYPIEKITKIDEIIQMIEMSLDKMYFKISELQKKL